MELWACSFLDGSGINSDTIRSMAIKAAVITEIKRRSDWSYYNILSRTEGIAVEGVLVAG